MDTMVVASDFADVNTNIEQGNMCNNTSPHKLCMKTALEIQC